MHGSGAQTCKHSRHMWPVPHSPVATVASNGSHLPNFFSKDGRKIRVGDCALFKPLQDSPPFIGIIRRLSLYKEDSITLGVHWLYRTADIKLAKETLLEAAPNEVFYSFHKDEIPAASLLHPCKVAFLRKGVELPSGVSSFVCRRVYDIENRCLWWLTDKDFINERQEEVDKLLEKTRLEMHGGVQPGGRSPRPLNGSSSAHKSGSDSIQNSTSSSFQIKEKKRERGEQGSDSAKREPLSKIEDGESAQFGLENVVKSEVAKITEKGGLVDFEGVERLVQLMQPDSADKKIDLAGRIVLVDVIAMTDRLDCLGQFVHLGGLSVLDDWLQEVHNGKIGDSSSSKESDKSVDEFLLALLRALDKLPVNLRALQECNVGKSVNHLRYRKNSKIQKKSRSLVDTWKKRVQAEMNMNDAKTGSGRVVSWSNNNKPTSSEVSQVGSRKTGSSTEVGSKNLVQHAVSKTMQVRHVTGEVPKTSASPGATKTLVLSAGMPSNDQNLRTLVVAGGSDVPLSSIKDERSSSSSQSQNNSQSSDHVKTLGSTCREDAKSSTAGSLHVNKISRTVSRHRKSGNGAHGSAISGAQKETVSGRFSNPGRSHHSEKSLAAGVSHESPIELPLADHGNNRLIVRLPNTGCSPTRGASAGSLEDQGVVYGRVSPGEKHDNHEEKHKGGNEAFRPLVSSDVNSDSCQVRMTCFEEGEVPSVCGEWHKASEDGERSMEVFKETRALPKITSRLGKSYDASLCSINALIESCAKFSEANASVSPGDDVGMNLLASVAAGEISKSNNASPSDSPCMDSPVPEASCLGDVCKLKQVGDEVVLAQSQSQSHVDGNSSAATLEQHKAGDFIQSKAELRHFVSYSPTTNSGDSKGTSSLAKERAGEHSTQLNCSSGSPDNIDAPPLVSDMKLGDPCDASTAFLCSGKESFSEAEGVKQVDEQRKSGSSCAKSNNISDSEFKTETPLPGNVKKECYADEITKEDITPVVAEAEADMDCERPICSTLDVGVKSQNSKEESSNDIVKEQKSSHVSKGDADFVGRKNDVLLSASGNATDIELTGEQDDCHAERMNEQTGDICPASEHDDEPHLERKLNESVVCSVPISHDRSPSIPLAGREKQEDSSQQKSSGEILEEQVSSSVSASGPDTSAKLDFDLNEGFPVDDGSNGELTKVGDPGPMPAVHLPCPLPFRISSISSSFPTSITVVAPAKGPFVLPENPLRSKGELGWKGSAATSAFRPAEPRKNLEMPPSSGEPFVDTSNSMPRRTPLDFDLNVPDEKAYDDIASQCATQGSSSESRSHDRGAGGLDLDLNRVDESFDTGPFSDSNNSRMEIPPLSGRSSLSSGCSNGGINASRDFDLNNGPGLDDIATEITPRTQPLKVTFPLSAPVSGIRAEFGNFLPWLPGNSYSGITIPSIFPSRTDQGYVSPAGSQRVLCPGSTPFGPEMYRGPVLSSSPALAFPPTPSFQYPGFPFETSFPLSSRTFSGGSAAYMDSSSGGTLCFPTIPSQLVGPAGVLSSPFPRPYVMSIPGAASNVFPDGRKWTSQGLDLNTGPGNTDTERRDERLSSGLRQLSVPTSQALVEEQLKVFQVGGVLKRKEPDGGLDPVDRISYKQHSWQ